MAIVVESYCSWECTIDVHRKCCFANFDMIAIVERPVVPGWVLDQLGVVVELLCFSLVCVRVFACCLRLWFEMFFCPFLLCQWVGSWSFWFVFLSVDMLLICFNI